MNVEIVKVPCTYSNECCNSIDNYQVSSFAFGIMRIAEVFDQILYEVEVKYEQRFTNGAV